MQLDPNQLERLRPLVEAETGMDFSGSRFARLCDAAEKVLVTNNAAGDLDRLLTNSDERGPVLEQLTAELTVGESFFFRNEHHFQALREQVMPEILQRNADRRAVRIWSAGCAAGEEPFSLSILLDQMLGAKKSEWSVSILGTDINTEFLRRARNAEYRPWSFRRTEIHNDPRYFSERGNVTCLQPHVRDGVRFVYLNLVKDVYPSALTGTVGLDLILFRNVAIYLQPAVVRAIVARFHDCLQPGGWLLLGEAEVSHVRPEGFEVRRIGPATFFQKPLQPVLAMPPAEPPRPVLPTVYGAGARRDAGIAPAVAAGATAPQVQSPTHKLAVQQRTFPAVDATPFDWQHVEQHLLREEFAAAEGALKAIRDCGKRAKMRLRYVRRLLEFSELGRAREMLDACLAEEPLMIDGHLLKASLAEERGDVSEAESACRRALYLDRNCAMAHFHLALVQQQRGDLTGAQRSLRLVQKVSKSQHVDALVEHGDGVCYGRLWEMAQSMLGS